MTETNSNVKVALRKLVPSEGMHLKNINNGDIYEGTIYLGTYDDKANYEEVTEEAYQEYLAKQDKSIEVEDL